MYLRMIGKRTKSPKAIGIFFAIFGLSFLVAIGAFFASQEIFKISSIKTKGKVIDSIEIVDNEGKISYKTKYAYIDFDGKEHIKLSSSSSSPKEYENGTIIDIYYLKKDYDRSIYQSKTTNLVYLLFSICGLVFCIIGLILYYRNRNSEIVWEKSWLAKFISKHSK